MRHRAGSLFFPPNQGDIFRGNENGGKVLGPQQLLKKRGGRDENVVKGEKKRRRAGGVKTVGPGVSEGKN